MRTLHLFAGAGGGLLADLILGHQPVAAVEWDSYCCAVLRERAADGWFPALRVHEGDVRLFDPSEYTGRVDCIAAGFPCQDISLAGAGAGIDGGRSGLWAEVVRVAHVVRPRFLFLENSPAIVNRGLEVVLHDLSALGFDADWLVLPASATGAPHIRARWFCFAWRTDAKGKRRGKTRGVRHGESAQRAAGVCEADDVADTERAVRRPRNDAENGAERRLHGGRQEAPDRSGECGEILAYANGDARNAECADLPDAVGERQERLVETGSAPRPVDGPGDGGDPGWWAVEPDVGRVVNGVASRVDRLRALGNGQVPLQAAAAFKILHGQ